MNYAVNNSDFGLDVEDYLIGEVSDNSNAYLINVIAFVKQLISDDNV